MIKYVVRNGLVRKLSGFSDGKHFCVTPNIKFDKKSSKSDTYKCSDLFDSEQDAKDSLEYVKGYKVSEYDFSIREVDCKKSGDGFLHEVNYYGGLSSEIAFDSKFFAKQKLREVVKAEIERLKKILKDNK